MQQKELAKLLGIGPAMVSRHVKRGMPTDSLERAQRWRKRHLEPGRVKGTRFNSAQGTPAPQVPNGAPIDSDTMDTDELGVNDDGHVQSYEDARRRRELAEATIAEMKQAEMQGLLIRTDAVRGAWAAKITGARDALLQIPSRLAPVLAAESDLVKVATLLEDELHQALAELSGGSA